MMFLKTKWKEYLRSAGVTFIASFLFFFMGQLEASSVDYSALSSIALIESVWRTIVRAALMSIIPATIDVVSKIFAKVKTN